MVHAAGAAAAGEWRCREPGGSTREDCAAHRGGEARQGRALASLCGVIQVMVEMPASYLMADKASDIHSSMLYEAVWRVYRTLWH